MDESKKSGRIRIWSRVVDRKYVEQVEGGAWAIRSDKSHDYIFDDTMTDVEEYTDQRAYDALIEEATASTLPVLKLPTPKPNTVDCFQVTGRKFR